MLPLQCRLFFGCVKSIGYFASAVYVVSTNPCVGASPRIKISFPLLSIYYQLFSFIEFLNCGPKCKKCVDLLPL